MPHNSENLLSIRKSFIVTSLGIVSSFIFSNEAGLERKKKEGKKQVFMELVEGNHTIIILKRIIGKMFVTRL